MLRISCSYQHRSQGAAFLWSEAAEKLQPEPAQVFKTTTPVRRRVAGSGGGSGSRHVRPKSPGPGGR
jgi:hypothetical protein